MLSDVQLLLATMEDGKTSVSKEELEKVHSQVRRASQGERLFWETQPQGGGDVGQEVGGEG